MGSLIVSILALWRRALGVGGVVVLSLLGGAAVAAVSPTPRVILLTTIACALAAPLVRRGLEGRFDPLEPIFVIALAYGVMFVLRPLATISSGEFVYFISAHGVGIDETFDEMLLLAALGAIAIVTGYEVSLGPRLAARLSAPRSVASEKRLLLVTLAFAAGGLALFAAFLGRNGGADALAIVLSGRSAQLYRAVADTSKYLYFGPFLLIPATLVSVALGWKNRRGRLLLLAGLLVAAVLITRGPVGSRITLMPLFGALLVYYFLARDRRPSLVAVVTTLAIGLTLSAFILGVRDTRHREQIGTQTIAAQLLSDPLLALNPLLSGQDAAEAPALASTLTLVPEEIGHTYGAASFGDLLMRPIPRAVWAEKPKPPRERVIDQLWPALYRQGAANPEFSMLFVLYLDGGLVGVLIGMFACGVVLSAGYCYLQRHSERMIVRLLYAAALPFVVVLLRDGVTDALIRSAFVLVPLYLAYRIASLGVAR